MKRKAFFKPAAGLAMLLLLALASTASVLGHGAQIAYRTGMAIEVVATFDNGEPMAGAQVTVYAPDDPAATWLSGVTDDAGRFVFLPDPDVPGSYDVQVRQAGHGDIAHIPTSGAAVTSGMTGFTTMQLVLMGACVIWGFIGTALYFSRSKA